MSAMGQKQTLSRMCLFQGSGYNSTTTCHCWSLKGDDTVMDALTLFGVLVFYALEDRSHWYILAFAGACALGSAYGFLQGAWPFGVVEAIWAGVAMLRWRTRMKMRERPA